MPTLLNCPDVATSHRPSEYHSRFGHRLAFATVVHRRFGAAMSDGQDQSQQSNLNISVHLRKQQPLLGVISILCGLTALATSAILLGMRPFDNRVLWNSALVIEPLVNYSGILCAIIGGMSGRNKKLFPIVGGMLNLLSLPVSLFAMALLLLIISEY
jgi:hypothetical protein